MTKKVTLKQAKKEKPKKPHALVLPKEKKSNKGSVTLDEDILL